IDSTTPSGRDDSSTARTASSTTDGEDEQAGTGTPLVIGWLQHLQITTPPVPALNPQVRRLHPDFAAALMRPPTRSSPCGRAPALHSLDPDHERCSSWPRRCPIDRRDDWVRLPADRLTAVQSGRKRLPHRLRPG